MLVERLVEVADPEPTEPAQVMSRRGGDGATEHDGTTGDRGDRRTSPGATQ